MTLEDILIFGGCCIAASLAQSLSGFGFGVVVVAVLPLLGVALVDTVVLIGLLVLPNLTIALWRLRRDASLRRVAWVLVALPVGMPLGVWLLTRGSEPLVRFVLGGVLIFAAIEPSLGLHAAKGPGKRSWAFAAGVLSGALGAAFGTGGPPVIVYYYRRRWPKEVTKASLMLTFLTSVLLRVPVYAHEGLITAGLLARAAAFCPAVVVGTVVGERLFGAVSQEGFRKVVAGMLLLCGTFQVVKAGMLCGLFG